MARMKRFYHWASARHPAFLLFSGTLVLYALALAPGLALSAYGGVCSPLYWACVSPSGGQNACMAYTSCASENPPGQCTILNIFGQTLTFYENAWSGTWATPWPSCANIQSSGPGSQCQYLLEPCGTTYHYATAGCVGSCNGTWQWAACEAMGDPCQ